MKRAKQIEQHHYSGSASELDRHIPLEHHPLNQKPGHIRLFTPDERFKTRTGAIAFAYKRISDEQYLFYAYHSDE